MDDQTPQKVGRPRRKWLARGVLMLLVLALAFAVVGNVFLYRQSVAYLRRLSEARLDPYGMKLAKFPPEAPANADKSLPVFLFFGDSRAERWPAPAVAGYRFINRGIGGQTTEQVRGRLDQHLTPLSPRVVLVQAGINDLKAIPLLPDRRDQIVADCKSNLRTIVATARAGGATVIVTTIFPPGGVPLERRPIWSPAIEQAVEEVNADLRSLAGAGVLILDAWKVLESGGKLRAGYGADTLHLSAQGYAVLNAELVECLKRIGNQSDCILRLNTAGAENRLHAVVETGTIEERHPTDGGEGASAPLDVDQGGDGGEALRAGDRAFFTTGKHH